METKIIKPELGVKLVGLSGPYRDCTYPIRKDEYLIGRSPDCDMVLEETTVSGKHARIVKRGEHHELEDLRSTNGTFVAGVKIDIKKLRNDDRVRFDRFEFRFINPLDVSRTVVAEAPGFAHVDQTAILEATAAAPRPPSGPPSPPRPLAELVQPPPASGASAHAAQPRHDGAASGSARNTLGGFLLGLVVAYLLGVIAMTVVTFARAGLKLDVLPQVLRQAAILHPGMHLHPAWMGSDWRNASVIAVALALILALVLGGWIMQNGRRRVRISSALFLALGFVLLSLLIQAASIEFNFAAWPRALPPLIPSLGAWGNFALCVAYFFAVALAFGWLGTLLGRREQ